MLKIIKDQKFLLGLLLLCYSYIPQLNAQYNRSNFRIHNIDTGLPDNSLNFIFQDESGFVWVGTENGLVRFDGEEYKTYELRSSKSPDLRAKRITHIFEDQESNIWIASNIGIYKWERDSDTIHEFSFAPQLNNPGNPAIIHMDRSAKLWIAFYSGERAIEGDVYLLDPLTKKWSLINNKNGTSDEGLSSLSMYIDGSFVNAALYENQDGKIWLGDARGKGMYIFDPKSETLERIQLATAQTNSLSHNTIRCFFEDSEKNLWMGTFGGLYKYKQEDKIFEYKSARGTPYPMILTDSIYDIREDREGFLWLTKKGQLDRFNPRTSQFKTYFRIFSGSQIGLNTVWIGENEKNQILFHFVLGSRVAVLDKGKDALTEEYYQFDSRGKDNRISSAFLDKKDQLWLAFTKNGMLSENPYRNNFINYLVQAGSEFTHSKTNIIFEDSEGMIWLGGVGGLFAIDSESGRMFPIKNFKGVIIESIYEDSQKRLWVGTLGRGLFKLDLKKSLGFRTNLALNAKSEASSSELPIYPSNKAFDGDFASRWGSAYKDRQWISVDLGEKKEIGQLALSWETAFSTNYQVQVSNDQKSWRTIFTQNEGLGGKEILDLSAKAQYLRLLFLKKNTPYGVSLYEFEVYGKQPIFEYFYTNPGNANFESQSSIHGIVEDKAGKIWITGSQELLAYYDEAENRIKRLAFDQENSYSLLSPVIGQGEKLQFLSSNQKTLGILNTRTKHITYSSPKSAKTNSPIEGVTRIIDNPDSKYTYIFTSENGFLVSRNDSNSYTSYLKGQVISPNPNAFSQDENGQIWIATLHNGAYKFDPEKGEFVEHLTVKQGLPSDRVYGLRKDKMGNYWFFTDRGLSLKEKGAKGFKHFNKSNGLLSNNLLHYSFIDENNNLYLASDQGLQVFRQENRYVNLKPPKVVITQIANGNPKTPLGDPSVFNKNWEVQHEINLSYDQNILSFQFSVLDYDNYLSNQYSVMLEGLEDDFNEPSTENSKEYSGLAPGSYTLKIKAANADGIESEQTTDLLINISPPWYQSWEAIIAYILILGLAVYFYNRYRIKATKAKLEESEMLNQRLRTVDRLKDQFLANTSHELRTPLNGIIGLSESLLDREEAADKKEDLSLIISSGKRLSSLVNDILDFSKIKSFDIELNEVPINMYVLANVVIRNISPLLKGKELRLKNNIPSDFPAVWGDENRLQQVLYNLVGNAIKFTASGEISLGVAEKSNNGEENFLQFYVRDTGIGIPKNKLNAIFDAFEQVDASISREFAGTGLGLSVSKKLIELHGGNMWVESEINKGSTFFFSLPKSTVSESLNTSDQEYISSIYVGTEMGSSKQDTRQSSLSLAKQNGKNNVRVLIVDDDPINRKVLENHLQASHFQLAFATNGEEALEAIDNNPDFDLILMDVMMPKMSGYEACEKIREKYLSSELPIIMVTAKNQLDDLVQGLQIGANDYLAKPFSKQEFLARVQTQLDLHLIFDITSRFIPNAFIRSLGHDRITEVKLGDSVEKEVTVLFTDIRGYTRLSESMNPSENFRFVNAFHRRLGPIIQKHGGFVNQYLGDAIMAIFPGNPEKALLASIDMQESLRIYNVKRKKAGRVPITVGIGFHTGSLIMGIIGDEKRMDAATISDAVNTASRLEGLTKYFGAPLVISDNTYQMIRNKEAYTFRFLGETQLKGKQNAVKIYECLDAYPKDQKLFRGKFISLFEEGLEKYFNRDFLAASAAFKLIVESNPEDKAAELYLKKSAYLLAHGVPEDWTGIEFMESK